jgi:hypothetical protein
VSLRIRTAVFDAKGMALPDTLVILASAVTVLLFLLWIAAQFAGQMLEHWPPFFQDLIRDWRAWAGCAGVCAGAAFGRYLFGATRGRRKYLLWIGTMSAALFAVGLSFAWTDMRSATVRPAQSTEGELLSNKESRRLEDLIGGVRPYSYSKTPTEEIPSVEPAPTPSPSAEPRAALPTTQVPRDAQASRRRDGREIPKGAEAQARRTPKKAKRGGGGSALSQGSSVPTVYWNLWAEPAGRLRYRPLPDLRPNTRYVIAVHLSPARYLGAGVVPRPTGAGLVRNIDEWIAADATSIGLTALVLPDPASFETGSSRARTLSVNLDAIRKRYLGKSAKLPGDPLKALADHGDRSTVFGEVSFEVRTTARTGPASIGVSFWDPQGRPLEETSATFCVAADAAEADVTCPPLRQVAYGFHGVDSLRAAAQGAAPPDAALHFVELGRDGAIGVFRNNAAPAGEYVTWRLRTTIQELQDYLERTLLPDLGKAQYNADNFADKGTDLYERFFPSTYTDGRAARAAFERFVGAQIVGSGGGTPLADPPSIFVRMVPRRATAAPIVPFGLVAVTLNETPQFIGHHFRIETPLPVQDYGAAPACLSRWRIVIPREDGWEDDELKKARKQLSHRIPGWDASSLYQEMIKFGRWAREDARDAEGTAVFVVSHHDRNRIFFTEQDSMTSVAFRRRFQQPSLAVLSGCGTGGPGALDFIRRLSEQGMSAIIATNAEVDGEMAGRFVDCLASVVEQNANVPDFNISRAYFATLRCMRVRDPERGLVDYGARVLLYTFLGNGSLRLCPPITSKK